MIPFNKPYLTGNEIRYVEEAMRGGKLSGNGAFTQKCHRFFEERYNFKKCLLTTSCTDALEMCAMLANINAGDEVIVPAYTFVTTALAFVRFGAKIVFADSMKEHPNIDCEKIEPLVTPRTKAIVVMHYAGVSCDMDAVLQIAKKHNLIVIEDCAQAIDSYFINKSGAKISLGGIGHLSTFSFHETKNIICGEGGMLAINDEKFIKRAEIIWEKGTNRAAFFRGEVNKYGWIDTGSSFLPNDITAAFLFAQLEKANDIFVMRKIVWDTYHELLTPLANENFFELPQIPSYATNNAHAFFIVCKSLDERTKLIAYLKERGVTASFHYLGLHKSEFYKDKHDGRALENCDKYTDRLVRLPLYCELSESDVKNICSLVRQYYFSK